MTPVPEEFTARDRGHHNNKKLEVSTRPGHLEGPARGFVRDGPLENLWGGWGGGGGGRSTKK